MAEVVGELSEPCSDSGAAVAARVADILRPAGALARLDEVAIWLAGWQGSASPTIDRPAALLFAGDHGVAADGVSAYPQEVTAAMMAAFDRGRASVSVMAGVAGATVAAIDVGVGRPTGNITTEPAMAQDRFDAAYRSGRAAVAGLETDLLIVGEMGIGNTTAAAAVSSALLGRPAPEMVGAGTGIDDQTRLRKIDAVERAVARANGAGADRSQPFEVLRQLGGTELVAMVGAMAEARRRSLPVLLDGYVTAASALTLHVADHHLTEHLWAGHVSAEPGHRLVLDALGLRPLIDLDFRLGEGSGAMAALPLLQMACRLVTDVPTFAEWFGST